MGEGDLTYEVDPGGRGVIANLLWIALTVLGGASWIVYLGSPSVRLLFTALFCLLGFALIAGGWLIFLRRSRGAVIAGVLLLVIGGQWWGLVWAIVMLGWSVTGFAP